MSEFENFGDDIKNDLLDFFARAQIEQSEFVKECAVKLRKWTAMYAAGQLTKKEFERLLKANERTIKQSLNSLEIEARVRAEKVLFGIIDVIKGKILPTI